MYENTLKQLGLTENEAKIYEILLELGPSPAINIAQKSNLKRSLTYNILDSLEKKGLTSKKTKGKKTIFIPESPNKLEDLIIRQREILDGLKANMADILPSLKSKYNLAIKKPGVKFYEGIDGIKEIYQDTLREKQPIYAFESLEAMAPEIKKWLLSQYVPKRVENNIFAKTIVSYSEDQKEEALNFKKTDQFSKRETRLIPKEESLFETEINIYGQKVAFISFKKEELIGVIIESQAISKTMRAIFDICWETTKL